MSKSKVEKLDVSEAKNVIIEYMEKEYRPYGITDLVLNLHNRISKVLIAKILDELVEENKLIVKRYGKLSFYCNCERKDDENIKPIDLETLKGVNEEIRVLNSDYAEFKKTISILKSEPTDTELILNLEHLKQTKVHLLDTLRITESKDIDKPDDKKLKEINDKEKQVISNYKQFKKIHTEIINTLKEGIENFKEKSEELGLENIPEIEQTLA